jgi:hypothetical protein
MTRVGISVHTAKAADKAVVHRMLFLRMKIELGLRGPNMLLCLGSARHGSLPALARVPADEPASDRPRIHEPAPIPTQPPFKLAAGKQDLRMTS